MIVEEQGIGFRTGVRFPSAPLKKKSRKYATFSFCFLSSLSSKKAPAPKCQSFFHIFSQLLFDLVDPAFRSFNLAHLDAGQGIVQLLDGRAHLFHTAREADFFAVVYNLSHR